VSEFGEAEIMGEIFQSEEIEDSKFENIKDLQVAKKLN